MPRYLIVFATACLVLIVGVADAGQPTPKEFAFKVTAEANIKMTDSENTNVQATAQVEYSWKREGKVRTLQLGLMNMQASADGKEMINAKMSRAGVIDGKSGKTTKFEDASERQKKVLLDLFGSPLCKLEVDENGKEVKRTITEGLGAAALLAPGAVANATMFHAWYPADKDEWQGDLELSIGTDIVRGKVTYTKVPGGKSGQAVKVSGTITVDKVIARNGQIIKDGKYVIKGEQIYDPERKEWVAGTHTINLSFQVTDGAKVIGNAKGEMTATLELLPEKK